MEFSSEFVGYYYQMNPEKDDVVMSSGLKDGMIVLLQDPYYRVQITSMTDTGALHHAMATNRWCMVTQLVKYSSIKKGDDPDDRSNYFDGVVFIGVYADGTKVVRKAEMTIGWVVDKESIPKEEV